MKYKIILYYNFSPIKDIKQFWADHRRKCIELQLKGRVYLAKEGINGTLAGTTKQIEAYKQFLCSLAGFENTVFKENASESIPFRKLIVRIRPEIVALKASIPIDPCKEHGKYLSPKQWRKVLESRKDVTLIDARNNYESQVGHFKDALCPDVENFFDFEQWLDQAALDKDKKVLMYCTGGIRCEKFSLLMEKKGFKDVNQLAGGIISYGIEEAGAHYKGKCFVFDDRLTIDIERDQTEPLSKCEITGVGCDQFINCANRDCNKLFICSEEGARKYEGCCSEKCTKAKNLRPFDQNNIYQPSLKKYQYM